MEARKDDIGKLRFDLIPIGPLREVAKVFTIGASKYEDRNWEKGLQWGRCYAALQRHATSWWFGETYDQENGQHHLASVIWNAMALLEYEHTHKELDDRPTFWKNIHQGLDMTRYVDLNGNAHICNKFKQGTDPDDYVDQVWSNYGTI